LVALRHTADGSCRWQLQIDGGCRWWLQMAAADGGTHTHEMHLHGMMREPGLDPSIEVLNSH
jgi:hypothetical protein